jgi:hypothetical protein
MYRSRSNGTFVFIVFIMLSGVLVFPQMGLFSLFVFPLVIIVAIFIILKRKQKRVEEYRIGDSYLYRDNEGNSILVEPNGVKYLGEFYPYEELGNSPSNVYLSQISFYHLERHSIKILFKDADEKNLFMKSYFYMKLVYEKQKEEKKFMEMMKK